MNGNELERGTDYTDRSGSTIITLTESYLKTLAPGEYTMTAYFTDGYAEAKFTVENHVASDADLEKWAAKDYQGKTGTAANAAITAKSDGQYEITLSDEGNNRCYGIKRKSLSGKIQVGDSAEIFVNPQDPHDFFDMLGEDCLKSARFNVILSIVMGIGIFVMLILR